MRLNRVMIVYQFNNCGAHKQLKASLKTLGISYRSINRKAVNANMLRAADLIITVGGDGTFLRTSHFIRSPTPILGMNADPKRKVGFFCRCDVSDITKRLQQIKDGSHTIRKLTRLRCLLNGKELPSLALNEFFVSHSIPWKLSRYNLDGEFQRSSGVIIGTASGSHAWLGSAGGRRQPLESRRFQYLVRELYRGTDRQKKRLQGILDQKARLTIISDMKDGIIVVDCLSKPYRMKKGDIAEFATSAERLCMVDFQV